jgi:hypothetical protein
MRQKLDGAWSSTVVNKRRARERRRKKRPDWSGSSDATKSGRRMRRQMGLSGKPSLGRRRLAAPRTWTPAVRKVLKPATLNKSVLSHKLAPLERSTTARKPRSLAALKQPRALERLARLRTSAMLWRSVVLQRPAVRRRTATLRRAVAPRRLPRVISLDLPKGCSNLQVPLLSRRPKLLPQAQKRRNRRLSPLPW